MRERWVNQLFDSSKAGDIGGVTEALDHGITPDYLREETCIIKATGYKGDVEIRTYSTKLTPLALAVYYGRNSIVNLLVSRGASIHTKVVFHWEDKGVCLEETILSLALKSKRFDLATYLLDQGADANACFQEQCSGVIPPRVSRSPLGYVISDDLPIDYLRLLIERGARIDQREKYPLSFKEVLYWMLVLFIPICIFSFGVGLSTSSKNDMSMAIVLTMLTGSFMMFLATVPTGFFTKTCTPLELARSRGQETHAALIQEYLAAEAHAHRHGW